MTERRSASTAARIPCDLTGAIRKADDAVWSREPAPDARLGQQVFTLPRNEHSVLPEYHGLMGTITSVAHYLKWDDGHSYYFMRNHGENVGSYWRDDELIPIEDA